MALFIDAGRKRQMDEWKHLANASYAAGCIGSMAFAKKRPRFDEVFKFPDTEDRTKDIQVHKAQMIAWATSTNRAYRKAQKAKEVGYSG
nr:MAG TPA: hypothetical protein [Caudoviricetes sp.]